MIEANKEVLRILDERLGKLPKADKNASGEWTIEAVARYGNRYADGTPMVEDEESQGNDE